MTKHTVARVEDMIATEDDAEVSGMLRAYATLLTEKEDNGITHWNGTTHYAGCIQAGPKHYECALQEIGRLRGTIMDLRVKLEAADNRNTAMMKMGDRLIAEREVAAKAEYERGFDDGFILRKEKDKGAKSEYICTCGIRVTPHKCPTDNGF
jgi:hypothetical protein